MNEFREHYTPDTPDEPHPLAVLGGAAALVLGLYLITIVLFTL